MKREIAILSIGLLAAASAAAGVLSPRARILAVGSQTRSENSVPAYIMAENGASPWEELKTLGVSIDLLRGRVATARLDCALLAEAAEVEGVESIHTSTPLTQMMDVARTETGLADCWQTLTPEFPQGFDGRDVVVGVIDAGLDYGHESFRDSEGRLRIERIWEQSTEPGENGSSPEKFGYGLEMKDPETILRAEADITGNSHGTHVAAIAAGSSEFAEGAYRGVAPGARIVLVSMGESDRNNVNLSNAISYIFDYAESLGLPCVVNLSLGNHAGPHDGTSPFDLMADELVGPGRILVGSAGNHGNDHFHIERDWTDTSLFPVQTFIDFRTTPSAHQTGGDIDLWYDPELDPKVELVCWSDSKKEIIERIELDLSTTDEIKKAEFSSNIKGQFIYSIGGNTSHSRTGVTLHSEITSVRSRHSIGLVVTPAAPGKLDIWADNIYFGLTGNDVEGWNDSNGSTIAEIGGTASRMLSVGAYTTRNTYTLEGSSEERTLPETLGAVSSFSGYGPTADGRMKPEVIAPGCFIISSVSRHDGSGTLLPAATHTVEGDRDYVYGYMQGTSMSAPFVTGTVALWLQADPDMSPERLKEIVARTTRGEGMEPDSHRGYGKIAPKAGLDIILSESGINGHESDGTPYYAIGGKGVLRVMTASGENLRVYGSDGAQVAVCCGQEELPLPAGLYLVAGSKGTSKVIVR